MKNTRNNHYTLLACLLSLTGAATAQPESATPQPMETTQDTYQTAPASFERYFMFGKSNTGKKFYLKLIRERPSSLAALRARQDLILTMVETPMFLEKIRPAMGASARLDQLLAILAPHYKDNQNSQLTSQIIQLLGLKAQCAYGFKVGLSAYPKLSELYEAATIVGQQLKGLDFSKKESHKALAENISENPKVYFDFIAEMDVYTNIAERICAARDAQMAAPNTQQPTYCFVEFDEDATTSCFNARNIWTQQGSILSEIASSLPRESDPALKHLIPIKLPATIIFDPSPLKNSTLMLQSNLLLATQFGIALAEYIKLTPLTPFEIEVSIETVNDQPQAI